MTDLVQLICDAYDAGRWKNDDEAVRVLAAGLKRLGWTAPPPTPSPRTATDPNGGQA